MPNYRVILMKQVAVIVDGVSASSPRAARYLVKQAADNAMLHQTEYTVNEASDDTATYTVMDVEEV